MKKIYVYIYIYKKIIWRCLFLYYELENCYFYHNLDDFHINESKKNNNNNNDLCCAAALAFIIEFRYNIIQSKNYNCAHFQNPKSRVNHYENFNLRRVFFFCLNLTLINNAYSSFISFTTWKYIFFFL